MQVAFPKLCILNLASLNVGKIWNGDQLRSLEFGFQSLTSLCVVKCDELKGLIPSTVATSLVYLRRLHVSDCKAMEEIVFIEESTQEATTFGNISFPKLETLELWNLPNLERFCGGNISFPKLETLQLRRLPNLECFCAGNCLDCSSLLKLEIIGCPKFSEFLTNSMPLDQVDKQRVLIHKVNLFFLIICFTFTLFSSFPYLSLN